jgi:hypothetical protein
VRLDHLLSKEFPRVVGSLFSFHIGSIPVHGLVLAFAGVGWGWLGGILTNPVLVSFRGCGRLGTLLGPEGTPVGVVLWDRPLLAFASNAGCCLGGGVGGLGCGCLLSVA